MRFVVLLYVASLIYSVVRYVAFMPENADNLPVFIVNKGVSMSAALCFAAAFLQQMRRMRGTAITVDPSIWFRAGIFGALAHIPMSLTILRPAYFGEFFAEERLSFGGEMVFLFGALAAAGIFLLTRTSWTPVNRWRLSLAFMLALFGHVLSMGLCRGLNINYDHAYLPPMWLLSLVGIGMGLLWLASSRPRAEFGELRADESGRFPSGGEDRIHP